MSAPFPPPKPTPVRLVGGGGGLIGVAVGLIALSCFSLALWQKNRKDQARVPAAPLVMRYSALPADYVGPGCTIAFPVQTSAGQGATMVFTYPCPQSTAATK